MGNTRAGVVARVPFTMHIDVELWKRVLACVDEKEMTIVGAIRESLRMWLEKNENNNQAA